MTDPKPSYVSPRKILDGILGDDQQPNLPNPNYLSSYRNKRKQAEQDRSTMKNRIQYLENEEAKILTKINLTKQKAFDI